MFKPGNDEKELAAWGFCEDDFPDEIVEVWPCMSKVVDVFQLVCDQWIMGAAGPVALNLQVPIAVMERMKLDDDEYFQMLTDIKLMAGVGLRVILESRPKKG